MFFSGCRLFRLVIRSWKPRTTVSHLHLPLCYTGLENNDNPQQRHYVHGSKFPANVKTSPARTLMPKAGSGFFRILAAAAESSSASDLASSLLSSTLVSSSRKGILSVKKGYLMSKGELGRRGWMDVVEVQVLYIKLPRSPSTKIGVSRVCCAGVCCSDALSRPV